MSDEAYVSDAETFLRELLTRTAEAHGRYERDLYAFVDARHGGLWKEIATKGTDKKAWNDLTATMKTVLTEFGREFAPDAQAVA